MLWASLVAMTGRNPPAMQETWVQSLCWEDPLEDLQYSYHSSPLHSSILAWRIPMDRGAWQATVHGLVKSLIWLSDKAHTRSVLVLPRRLSGKESTCNAADMGWEDPVEEEMATQCSILAWEIPWTEEPGGYSSWGCKELDTTEWLSTQVQSLY